MSSITTRPSLFRCRRRWGNHVCRSPCTKDIAHLGDCESELNVFHPRLCCHFTWANENKRRTWEGAARSGTLLSSRPWDWHDTWLIAHACSSRLAFLSKPFFHFRAQFGRYYRAIENIFVEPRAAGVCFERFVEQTRAVAPGALRWFRSQFVEIIVLLLGRRQGGSVDHVEKTIGGKGESAGTRNAVGRKRESEIERTSVSWYF